MMNFAIKSIVAAAIVFASFTQSRGEIQQPLSVQPVADSVLEYVQPDDEEPVRSPSDRAIAAVGKGKDGADKGGAGKGCASKGCASKGCGGGLFGRLPCNKCDDAWTLFPKDNCRGIDVGGWTQIGYHTRGVNGNGTGLFNNRPNEVQLQQMWAYIEKPVDTGGCGWDWGFRMDYVYGTDAQNTQAFGNDVDAMGNQGWDNEWDNGSVVNGYGHAIPQLYLQIGFNNTTVTLGHFFTRIGYEVVPAPDNFFYSKAVTMNNGEPFTHHGVLVDHAVNDCTTIFAGWTAGWDTGFDSDGGSTFIGGISRQVRDDLSVTWALITGDFGFATSGGGSDTDAYMSSWVLNWQVNDRVEYVLQHDFQDNQIGLAPVGQAHALNQYLFYTVNDCVRLGVRGEWAKIGANERSNITVGMNYTPTANITLRPEIRWDFSNFVVPADRRDTTLFGIDMIVTW